VYYLKGPADRLKALNSTLVGWNYQLDGSLIYSAGLLFPSAGSMYASEGSVYHSEGLAAAYLVGLSFLPFQRKMKPK
jgi:hypothetical protein